MIESLMIRLRFTSAVVRRRANGANTRDEVQFVKYEPSNTWLGPMIPPKST